MADIDVKLQCPERLVYNETLQRCDWPESTTCKSGNILVEVEDKDEGFCADKVNYIPYNIKQRLFSLSSLMEILLTNNFVIVIIFVKMAKMLSLHVKIIYDIQLKKMNAIGQ
jgi:hypothetical protein